MDQNHKDNKKCQGFYSCWSMLEIWNFPIWYSNADNPPNVSRILMKDRVEVYYLLPLKFLSSLNKSFTETRRVWILLSETWSPYSWLRDRRPEHRQADFSYRDEPQHLIAVSHRRPPGLALFPDRKEVVFLPSQTDKLAWTVQPSYVNKKKIVTL